MNGGKRGIWLVAALLGGFVLSFAGMGALWVGAAWPYQALMSVPFMLLALASRRLAGSAIPVLVGALPVAVMLVQFRDANNSHAMPVLVVAGWALGILLGHALGARLSRRA